MKLPVGIMAVTRQREVGQARGPEEVSQGSCSYSGEDASDSTTQVLGRILGKLGSGGTHHFSYDEAWSWPGLLSAEHRRCRLQIESVAP